MRTLEQLIGEAMLGNGENYLAQWHAGLSDEERAAFDAWAEETMARVTKIIGEFARLVSAALEPAIAVLTAFAAADPEVCQQTKEPPSCEC